MQKNSFVFHFDYLADIPAELRTEWTMRIINYAQFGTVPQFDDWRDLKTWNAIKNRMEAERTKYEKKTKNLKQNSKENSPKVYDFFDKTLSDTDKFLSVTDGNLSATDNELSDTDGNLKNSIGHRSEFTNSPSAGEFEFVNVNEFEFVNCTENAEPTNQPKKTNININYPFSFDAQTVTKINKSLLNANIEISQETINYAYSVISSKKYGPEKTPYILKNETEQKALYVSALLNYPADIFQGFDKWKKQQAKEEAKKKIKALEEAARASPPSVCKCGETLTEKGGGYMCFNCRRTYEIVHGKWKVNE